MRSSVRCVAEFTAVALLTAGRCDAQARWTTLSDYLEHGIGLTQSQLSALARGEVVGKLLVTGDDRDVAVFGAVHVDVPRSFFVDRQLDVQRAVQAPTRRVVHLFANPATAADVQPLQLSADDVKELRACRPNQCNFKLPVSDMEGARAVDASGADGIARVTQYARRRMLEFIGDYRRRGNAAMLVYDNRGSVHSGEALAALLRDSSHVFRMVPSLGRWLLNYPQDSLSSSREALFWAMDELPHVRPTLRIMHATLYSPPELPGTTVLAVKQLFANHYFEAGLELLTAVDRGNGISLVAVRSYRFDHLPSGGLMNVRGRVRGAMQDNVLADLARLKRDYEAAWRSAHSR